MRSLSPAHQAAARLAPEKKGNDIKAQADSDNLVLDPHGVRVGDLPPATRTALLELIRVHVSNLRHDQARVRMADKSAFQNTPARFRKFQQRRAQPRLRNASWTIGRRS